jgi:EAL domain-containing protein (putative c-di-GMP-specific phosphodiesterase class I)
MEALLRWTLPDRGVISPTVFIPIAEEMGLMVEIGTWVLREACQQLRAWRDAGLALQRVAVNISCVQLIQPDFVAPVERALAAAGLCGDDLEAEITESTVMRDTDRSVAALRALRERAVHVSMDDFGTGFSSLAQLQHLPLDRMKIDRSFVQRLPSDAHATAVVSTITALGQALGLSVTAEGVETSEQRDFLLMRGVTALQGHLFASPMAAAEAAAVLARGTIKR